MSELALGLDLGPTSIGWALIAEAEKRIIAAGVRVFPEGVDRDQQGGEQSKNEQRRIARGMRRQLARRSRRKHRIREALVSVGFLPEVCLLRPDDPKRVEWEGHAHHQADPYSLRVAALTEKLKPYELGRVFLHLAQRRGFLSNRKKDRTAKETSDLLDEMREVGDAVGTGTLGQYLLQKSGPDRRERIRNIHTTRKMYEDEFEAIWNAQALHHPALLTDALKYGTRGKQAYPVEPAPRGKATLLERFGLHGLLFFQRRMYWPGAAVGKCELEPKLARCPRADRAAQRFRLLQEVNNLRILDTNTAEVRGLSAKERQRLLDWLAQHKEIKFDEIPRRLGLLEGVRFNLERGDRKALKGMETDCLLASKNLFGKDWFERPDDEKNAIVRTLLDERLDDDAVIEIATAKWGLSSEAAQRLAALPLSDKYARYSLVAIEKLVPHLERGLPLNAASGVPCALSAAGYKKPHERAVGQRDDLPEPPEISNPIVRQALFEVRKLINAVIREYGKPAHIHIEMAREIKGNAEQRARISREQRDREAERDRVADELRNSDEFQRAGGKLSSDLITRYLLWEQQGKACIYSGRPISLKQLLGGEVDVDHVLPYPRSLDNSQMNRVLCFRRENALKGDRTPHEWLAAADPEKYDHVLQRAAKLPYPKAQRFRQPDVQLDDFFARQFVDTAYITTQVREYVECLGVDVLCPKGQHTAELRRRWGLNTVLRGDGLDLKNREDHRHHAVDAVVIAMTGRKRLQELARLHKASQLGSRDERRDEAWPGFRGQVEANINSIHVSHRALRHVRGALHEEFVYGPTKKPGKLTTGNRTWTKGWTEESDVFTRRKPITELTLAEVSLIRDERIKEVVLQRLSEFKIEAGRKKKGSSGDGKIPQEVWTEPLFVTPRKRSSSDPAQIRKVRVLRREGTICRLGNTRRFVKPGSTHHLCLFEFVNAKGKKMREAVFVDMIEASRRARAKEPLIQRVHPKRPDARFLFSLSRGEMVQGVFKGQQRLVVFNTAASTQGQIYFLDHTDARQSAKVQKFAVKANTLNGRKVSIDYLGRLRWAND
jgi:CRISPR-associated endonuclease Csn1